MIIDLNTSIWSSLDQLGSEVADKIRRDQAEHWGQFEASSAAHERAMTCVDGAVIRGFRSDLLKASVPNELIAEFVSRDPRRRIGVAGIDPMSPGADDDLKAAVALGLVGITVSPTCQGFHPTHSAAMRIYEQCNELSMPVFVTTLQPLTPSATLEFGRPALWDEVARCFPKLPVVLSQLGHPWVEEALVLLGKHENLYADISGVASRPWQLYNALLGASANGVMGRLMFGSGFPHDTPAKAIETLYSINSCSHGTQLPSIPRSQIRSIVERDSLACLGMETEINENRDALVSEEPPVYRSRRPAAAPLHVEFPAGGSESPAATPEPPTDD